MGKKGLKRKTRWRPLSISECADDTSTVSITNSTIETNIEEDDTYNNFPDKNSSSSYLRRKPTTPFSTSSTNRTDFRNNYNNTNNYYRNNNINSSNKHNLNNNSTVSSSTTSSSFNSSSRYSSYRRRPFSSSNHHQQQNDHTSNNTSKYYSSRRDGAATGNRLSSNRGVYRTMSEPSDKENISSKPQLNEDEYTRITTPRQDVIFKKSYLNQPKRYLSSTDTNTTSSAAASVVSTEESISATSVPSLSPEQCSSMADSLDPEQAFMYSYFDQNGVFYVNPFLPNGFDQYGQMFMLPYGYSPYMYPQEINSPSTNGDFEESQILDELNEKKSDLKDSIDVINSEIDNKNDIKLNKILSESCDSIQKTLKINNNDDEMKEERTIVKETEENSSEEVENEKIKMEIVQEEKLEIVQEEGKLEIETVEENKDKMVEKKENEEKTEEECMKKDEKIENDGAKDNNENFAKEINETIQETEIIPPTNPSVDYFGYGYQQFYPPIYYPYMYSQPFIPIFAEEYVNPVEFYNGNVRHYGARRRKRIKIDGNLTDATTTTTATTTDYSEDEYTEDDVTETPDVIDTIDNKTGDCDKCDNFKENRSINDNDETESKQIKFNTDVAEFVPRINKPHLNVHVKEFKPRNYTPLPQIDEQKPETNSTEIEHVAKTEAAAELTIETAIALTVVEEPSSIVKEEKETILNDTDSKSEPKVESKETNQVEGKTETKTTTKTTAFESSHSSSPTLSMCEPQSKEKAFNADSKPLPPTEIQETQKIEVASPKTSKQPTEKPAMTLAEKIKKALSEEAKIKRTQNLSSVQQSNNIICSSQPLSSSRTTTPKSSKTEKRFISSRNNGTSKNSEKPPLQQRKKLLGRKNEARNDVMSAVSTSPITTSISPSTATTNSTLTYAQMLHNNTNNRKMNLADEKLNTTNNMPATGNSTNNKVGLPIESQQNEKSVQSNDITAENSSNAHQQVWLTVKPKGKRGKQIKEVTSLKDEITFEKVEKEETPKVDQVNEIHDDEQKYIMCTVVEENKTVSEMTPDIVEESKIESVQDSKELSPNETTKNNSNSILTNQKKGGKSKNRRSRKATVLNKKLKGFELEEPRIEINGSGNSKRKSKEKGNRRSSSSSSFESRNNNDSDKIPVNVEADLPLTPNASEENLTTIDHIYGGREVKVKNSMRSFAQNSLDILNGFDYKLYKGSSILKEEEEMVLSVIKSLSHNQSKCSAMKTVEIISNNVEESKGENSESKSEEFKNKDKTEERVKRFLENSRSEFNESENNKENPQDDKICNGKEASPSGFEECVVTNEESRFSIEVEVEDAKNAENVEASKPNCNQSEQDTETSQQSKKLFDQCTDSLEQVERLLNGSELDRATSEEGVETSMQEYPETLEESTNLLNQNEKLVKEKSEQRTEVCEENSKSVEQNKQPVTALSSLFGEDQKKEMCTESSTSIILEHFTTKNNSELNDYDGSDSFESDCSTDNNDSLIKEDKENVLLENSKVKLMVNNVCEKEENDQKQNCQIKTSDENVSDIKVPVCNGKLSKEMIENEKVVKIQCNGICSSDEEQSFKNNKKESTKSINDAEMKTITIENNGKENSEKIFNECSNNENITSNGELQENDTKKLLENLDKSIDAIPPLKCTSKIDNDFYQLIKIDENMSTSIADQLKTLEDQLKNLERITSVTSLNGSRNDINEDIESPQHNSSLHTAENDINTLPISSLNSIPTENNTKHIYTDEIERRINPASKIHNDNENSINILVPNDHVLSGCEEKSNDKLLQNQNEITDSSSSQEEHHSQKLMNGGNNDSFTFMNCTQSSTKNTQTIDRIRSNSLESFSINDDMRSFQQIHQEQNSTNKIPDSKNTKAISDSSLNSNSFASSTSCKYPLTNAVKQWLKDNTKEKTPDSILRIPDDPTLSTKIKTSIIIHHHNNVDEENGIDDGENDDWCSEEDSDDENLEKNENIESVQQQLEHHPKNLLSNPSHVSSVKSSSKINRVSREFNHYQYQQQQNVETDNDSDYNSDSQQQQNQNKSLLKRYDHDDNTCERVASLISSDTIINQTEENEKRNDIKDQNESKINEILTIASLPSSLLLLSSNAMSCSQQTTKSDLLDYWDDEFIQNPKKWLTVNEIDENPDIDRLNENSCNNSIPMGKVGNSGVGEKNRKKKKRRKRKTSNLPQKSNSTRSKISPMTTTTATTTTSSSTLSIDEIELAPYESVYGRTIDYNRLLNENHYEFLSNTITSFNHNINKNNNFNKINNNTKEINKNFNNYNNNSDTLMNDNNNKNLINNDNKYTLLNYNNNNNENNLNNLINHNYFDNDNIKFTKNNNTMNMNKNINCLKPPEVCCVLM